MRILLGMRNEQAPRRRSRAQQRAHTRQRLLEAAASVFGQHGYDGASVDQVADGALLTKGAVYSNFASKEELFLAVLEERLATLVDVVGAADEADTGGRSQRVRPLSAGRRLADRLENDPTLVALSAEFWLHAMRHPDARYKLAARRRVLRARLAEAIERETDRAAPPPLAPAELASVVIALAEGLAQQRLLDPDAVRPGLLSGALAALFGSENGVGRTGAKGH